MTPVLAIVGSSNSGKTTRVEKLIARLTAKGLRIASIKHSHHQAEMDFPGKDSWRHKQAGATTSFLIGPKQMMMVADIEEELDPNMLVSRYCEGFDLVLVEGYNSLPGAKIEVVRAARSTMLRCALDELMAVVTDVNDLALGVPRFGLDDDQAVAAWILDWLNLTGSGNETAAHRQSNSRMTIMFCAFEGPPLILRLYGTARMVLPSDIEWGELYAHFDPLPGARQIFDMDVDLVHTSCGFGVPLYAFTGDRPVLNRWAEKKGEDGIRNYSRDKNSISLDGEAIPIPDDD